MLKMKTVDLLLGSAAVWFAADNGSVGRRIKLVQWVVPKSPYIKINVNGCFISKDKVASVRSIARNNLGNGLLFFSLPVFAINSLQVEALACFWVVSIAYSSKWRYIQLEMDSELLVNYINGKENLDIPWYLTIIIKKIRWILRKMSWSCAHGYREINRIADRLSK